jgi:hypothetical protein
MHDPLSGEVLLTSMSKEGQCEFESCCSTISHVQQVYLLLCSFVAATAAVVAAAPHAHALHHHLADAAHHHPLGGKKGVTNFVT